MLTSLRKEDMCKVIASDVAKSDGPFVCPKCGEDTILKKGMIKIHHFAHKPPIACEYGKGESEEHRKCKTEIYESLRKFSNITCELEKDLGTVVPDILIDFGLGKERFAIEVQISELTMQQIIHRTSEYNKLNIFVLWLAVYNEKLEEEKYTPKSWERWLHVAYYGRVYYWRQQLQIIPVHFDAYQLYVAESEWYDSEGEQRFAGGYHKKSKKYITPNPGKPISIGSDFKGQFEKAWSSGSIFVPDRRILIDRTRKWW